jgi:uncharacterized membrane protein required for colicin V production
MWLDLVALAVLAVFALLGALRGGFRTGMGLLALAAGYAAAVFGAAPLGPLVGNAFGLPELLALPVAGSLLFIAAYVLIGIAGFALRRAGIGVDEPSARSRFLGAVFGGMRGALVAILLTYLALWVDALRVTGRELPLPPTAGSKAGAMTGALVEAGVERALSDSGTAGRVAARVAARPASALEDIQALVDSPSVQGLRDEPLFWSYVEDGRVDVALTTPAATQLLRDDFLRERLYGLGLVSEAARNDRARYRAELALVLEQVALRIRGLREDPELQQLVDDPDVVAMVQSGDTMGLMAHPGFRALVERVAAQPVERSN